MAQERISTPESSSGRGLGGRLRAQFNRFLDRRTIPEELIIVGTALLVGIGTGLGAVIFIHLLEYIAMLTDRLTASIGMVAGTLLAMGLAGVAVGLIIDKFASEAKGHGVPEVMEAVAIKGGRIRARVAAAKVLASSLTIGTGGSAGREGPIVQVGAALGSSLGQFLRFSDERVNTLVACGAAAGIAATFNAPIAGTIFAMEVILGSFTLRYFGAVVISSVAASVISRMMLSERPAFLVPAYPLSHLAEIPIYVLLGLLAALVAVAFIQTLYYLEGRFDNWQVPVPVRTTVGMLATGVIALAIPGNEVLGPGLHFIGENIAVNVDQAIGMLAILLVAKLLATSFTLGSGNSGGVFAPSLFMGALLGGIVGTIANQLWPNVAVNPGAYAIVGMAALFAGAARAPITAVLIVFEMSNDYKLILPVMLATVLSTIVAELLFPESIYTLKLARKGISLERGRDIDVLESVTVSEVMTRDVQTVHKDATLPELSDLFAATHSHGFPILNDDGSLWGIITVTDFDRAVMQEMPRRTKASEIGVPRDQLITATASETVGDVLARMGTRGFGRMPVVDDKDPNRLLGIVKRHDIIRAYNIALARRAELQHRAKRMRIRNIDGTEFIEIRLEEGDRAVGHTVQEVARQLPRDCILVSIRRRGRMLIPHGDTVFQVGDGITAFVNTREAPEIRDLFCGQVLEQVGAANLPDYVD